MSHTQLPSGARRLIYVLLLFLVANVSLAADRHSLWAVKGKQNTVYLLGSIHMLPATEPLPAVADEAYRDSKKIVMEIDLDDMKPELAQQLTLEFGLLPAGESLGQQLSASQAAKLDALAKQMGFSAGILQPFRPWLAAIMITQLQLQKLGFDPQAGVEQRFVVRAQADGKEIIGLETLAEQLHLLADLPPKLQTQFLLQTIEEANDVEKEVGAMLQSWRTGDSAGLETFVSKGVEDFPELYRPLTADRNRRWVAKLEQLLAAEQSHLVIVGALHMVGRDGLIELLKAKGYKVEQR